MSSQTPAAHITSYGFTPGLYLPRRSTRSPSSAAPSTRKRDPRSQRPARLARFHHRRFRTSPGLRLSPFPNAPRAGQRAPAVEAGCGRRAHAALGCQALGELA
ncbi:hypothetical protein BD311DRAFT_779583 [Dichomitus squalens]|uniref:Uncharacterized protein n=1 Tax=Dichomitus squalens TaxID=114155 RepID=A0A4Q9MJY7_9APHY|nr:hypothetical protein BD311DRAFT_779583 [Dichomitus squalens]